MKKFLIYIKRVQVVNDHLMTVCCILTNKGLFHVEQIVRGQITIAVGYKKTDQL